MEAAGLAIGIAGLAGIFRNVIDLFDLFAAAQSLQHDATTLMTKLNIERFLLIRWAEEVRLIRHGPEQHDKRLDKPELQRLVGRILIHIQSLMGNANELENRYGVYDLESPLVSRHVITIDDTSQVSASGLAFFKELGNYHSRLIHGFSRQSSFVKRARWAIHDKEKFTRLITELGNLRSSLEVLLPRIMEHDQVNVTSSEPSLHNQRSLNLIDQALGRSHEVMAEEGWNQLRREKILDTLWFRKLDERKDSIEPAHRSTLQWALDPSAHALEWDNLAHWLESGSKIYWVCGKAGSGKSTLLRYVCENSITHRLLEKWGEGRGCHTASYFFWGSGEQEQSGLNGLARSLLHQLLSKRPDLIPHALPGMWKEEEASKNDIGLSQKPLTLPSLAEMNRAFGRIIQQFENCGERGCMFIDGLDELTGCRYHDAIGFIQRLTGNTNIKVLLSSRPIPECVDAFDQFPKLSLQDLNRKDIEHYVEDVIKGHNYMKSLLQRFPEKAHRLVSELADKSSGVFLWVVLACNSLRQGFSDFDTISELQDRVGELPRELEEMFKLMLERVDPRHRQQGARLLKICVTRQKELANLAERQKKRVPKEMYALALALVSDYNIESVDFSILTLEEKRELCKNIEGRLRSRTAGLLELTRRSNQRGISWQGTYCFCYQSQHHDPWVDAKVDFLHRSVFELLSQDDAWEQNYLRLPEQSFDPATALSLGSLQLAFQSIETQWPSIDRVFLHLYEGMIWGSKADERMPNYEDHIFWRVQSLFDLLSNVAEKNEKVRMSLLYPFVLSHRHPTSDRRSHAALRFAIQGGAVNYVKSHAAAERLAKEQPPQCGCPSLLISAGTIKLNASLGAFAVPSTEMVSLLLSMGCNPNALMGGDDDRHTINSYGETTPWNAWMDTIDSVKKLRSYDPEVLKMLDLTERFFEAGASCKVLGFNHLRDTLAYLVTCREQGVEVQARRLLDLISRGE